MKTLNKLWVFLVALAMSLTLVGVMDCRAADVKYKGKDGELKWTIDTEGHLEISGSGDYEKREDKNEWNKYNETGWLKYKDKIKTATVNVDCIYSTAAMFYGCSNLVSVDLKNLDTSYVSDMRCMFYNCKSLTYVDVSSFNTQYVTNMAWMFSGCSSLKTVDVSNFDVSNNKYGFSFMFQDCKSLEEMDLSTWKFQEAALIGSMFSGCEKLKVLNIKNYDFDADPGASVAFIACTYSLEKLISEESKYVDCDLYHTNKAGKYVYVWKYKNGAYHRLDMVGQKEGTTFNNTKTGGKYKVTVEGYKKKEGFKAQKPHVTYLGPSNKNKSSVTIPATVTYKGTTYEVASVAKNAFKNNTKVKKITLGDSVKTIGQNAFMNCKKLKEITVKSKKLISVGSNALKGVNANCTIKVPASKHSAYKKMFKNKGQERTVKIVK